MIAPEQPAGRWPPTAYDEEDLATQIRALVVSPTFDRDFYVGGDFDRAPCQGDVVELSSGVPVLDEAGEAATDGDVSHWLIIGNTCDFERAVDEVPWTQIVPLVRYPSGLLSRDDLRAHRAYQAFRKFYLPPWPGLDPDTHHVADLLLPVALHKKALSGPARLVARMSYRAWVLFHSCLVRFLARADGRFT